MMNFMMMTMATQINRAKRLVKLLERLLRQRELFDDDKLKLMVRNLELLVDDIKAEVYSDVQSYVSPPPTITQDYDEILEDDDGYPD